MLECATPAVVLFWARWSGAAKQQRPVFDAVTSRYDGRLLAATMNLDVHGKVPTDLGVGALPSFAFVRGGELVILVPGVKSEPEFVELIALHLGLRPNDQT